MSNSIFFPQGKKKIKLKTQSLSLRDFYNQRNRVLILRECGGVGDILMMRMIFEDFKRIMPEAHMVFALPIVYQRLAFWHPYIDEVLDSQDIDENKFGVSYNLTTPCVRYEMKMSPYADRHRAEIWTAYCGIKLQHHNMHLSLPQIISKYGENKLTNLLPRNKGYVCFAPISAMVSKDLSIDCIKEIVSEVKDMGYTPFILHNKQIDVDCPVLSAPYDQWLSLIYASDYVITVDTSAFHASYGFNKPTVGVFSWADGKVYGKFHKNWILVQRHRDDNPDWCGPCYAHTTCPKTKDARKPCITEITSQEILEAFSKLIRKVKPLEVLNEKSELSCS